MESVDGLFDNDRIDKVDASTPDSGEELGEETSEMVSDEVLEGLFEDATSFFGEPEGEHSGVGNADDGEGDDFVAVPEEALSQSKKKDKRTKRSQSHKKKKEAERKADPEVRESGIYAENEEFPPDTASFDEEEDIMDVPVPPASEKREPGGEGEGPDHEDAPRSGTAEGAPASSSPAHAPSKRERPSTDDLDIIDEEYEQVDLPDWADSIREKVNSNVAHAFLLHGNVRDYMVRNISIMDGIVAVLDGDYENFDIIAKYDQAHGLSFYGEDIEVSSGKNKRSLAEAYRERFIEEMKESQHRMSMPESDDIPNRDAVTLFAVISDMFEHASKTRKAKILLFIDYADFLVPDASSAQMKPDERKLAITLADISRSQAADEAGNVMIFTTDDITQLSMRIKSKSNRIEQIKIPVPDRDEREDFIENVLDVPENTLSDGTQIFEHPDSITKSQFAINSAGLSRMQIEDIILRALSKDEPVSLQLMKERKQEIIREDYDDVLEIVDPRDGFERIGGMDQLKEVFQEEIIEPIHAGEKTAVPMGVLLMSAPGLGKTMFSKAVAHEAGMNFVALNLNRIMEKWVGSTERNLDRALDCALAMAPTIVFIDEIDEALPNRADPNASAVNKRINQRLLTFFADTDHRGEVMILAATNYPEKIDPAFKRAGRFDMKIPMFAPDEFDRMRIIRKIAEYKGFTFSWFDDPDKVVPNPFTNLAEWIKAGNLPASTDERFSGEMARYFYTAHDDLGKDIRRDVWLPEKLIAIIDKKEITLQQLYENVRILFHDLPQRSTDASTGEAVSDEELMQSIKTYLATRTDVLGYDEQVQDALFKRIWRWEQIYSVFSKQTFAMTGAEMENVMNSAVNAFRKWKRKRPKDVQETIRRGVMKSEQDIPWYPFLSDACKNAVTQRHGIKKMEDMALINTSDMSFIPDALYTITREGKAISYKQRHEELITVQDNSTL